MSITPLTFTGVSQYSSDLQSILTRAVQIAQIPVTFLQNKDSDLLQKKTLLASLNTSVASFAGSLGVLGDVASHQGIIGSSSNASVVSVTGTNSSTPAVYTIDSVTSLAAAASERSLISYADSSATPVSSTGTVKLTVGSSDFTFALGGGNNTLVGLRDKINSLGAGVSASILTTSNGNYLSVTSNSSGAAALSLTDDPLGTPAALLTSASQGSDAKFKLNGISISQKSNLVNSVIGGVTFRLTGVSASPATITLSTDRSSLSSALQSFVSGYNTLRSGLTAQVGPNAGLLSGDFLVGQLQSKVREIAAFRTASRSVKSLTDLGITFDSNGTAQFDTTAFNALSDTNVSDAFSYIGSATSGLGKFAQDLRQFSDPITGLIRTEQDGFDRTDKSIQDQVGKLSDRINNMQIALSLRLQHADSLLAQLESQQKTITASLQGLSLVLYGKSPNQ